MNFCTVVTISVIVILSLAGILSALLINAIQKDIDEMYKADVKALKREGIIK